MAIPAIISCSLCSGVRRLAITVTCCGAGTCKSCAVKHITSSRACWACQAALTTKDVISDELLRKKIDELSDSSLLLCGVCAEMCKRGVSAPCCQAKACRSCAVKVVTGTRACWECRKPIEETGKLVNDELLRAAVEQFKECGVMDPEHWDKLAVTKEPEKDEVGEVESGGQGNDASITSETTKNQENRSGKGGGWFCHVENCHNMNLAANVECFRCGTERRVEDNRSHNTGQTRNRRKETVVVQAEADDLESRNQFPPEFSQSESVYDQDILSCSLNSEELLLLEEGEISMESKPEEQKIMDVTSSTNRNILESFSSLSMVIYSAEEEETTVAQQQKLTNKQASDTKPKREFSPIRPPLRQIVNRDLSSLRDNRGREGGGYGRGRGGYGGF